MPEETIAQGLKKQGVSRRDFLKLGGLLAAAMGLNVAPPVAASGLPSKVARGIPGVDRAILSALETKPRLPVIWLEFQDCAGCSEAISRQRLAHTWQPGAQYTLHRIS